MLPGRLLVNRRLVVKFWGVKSYVQIFYLGRSGVLV